MTIFLDGSGIAALSPFRMVFRGERHLITDDADTKSKGGARDLHASIWSLVPFVIVIPFAMVTRQVLPGLLVGLLSGAYMLHPTVLGGVQAALSYMIRELALPDNLRLILFLYGFGAFVGLVRVTGGVGGFTEWMTRRIKSVRSAFVLTWLSAAATFMAPDFRIVTVAPVMRHVFSRLRVPPVRVATTIDITSTPLCALVPIGTAFVGYMVGLLSTSLRHTHTTVVPYNLFLQSLPFNFFSIVALIYGLYETFFRRAREVDPAAESPHVDTQQTPPIRRAPKNALGQGRLGLASAGGVEFAKELGEHEPAGSKDDSFPDALELVAAQAPPSAANLLFPLGLLLVSTFVLTWWDGHWGALSVWQAFERADASRAMLESLLITLVCTVVWYTVRRQPIGRTMYGFLAGGNEMMGVIVLLVLVWAVSAVSSDLGFAAYIERTVGGLIPGSLIAPVLFVFGCLISYVIGSSFGTWGMLLPIGFSLASSTHASLALIAGAVFASGTFGGYASPLSDNTVAMATVMKLPLMDYARYKLKSALWIGGVSTVLYGVASFL